jgi:hypothetical protein
MTKNGGKFCDPASLAASRCKFEFSVHLHSLVLCLSTTTIVARWHQPPIVMSLATHEFSADLQVVTL